MLECIIQYKFKIGEIHPLLSCLRLTIEGDFFLKNVKLGSDEGDVIYIPFAGSGSEIESCIINNRSYIATEINNDYINNIIIPRISHFK